MSNIVDFLHLYKSFYFPPPLSWLSSVFGLETYHALEIIGAT